MKKNNNWFRRRWLDFRQGHSIYLIFLMTFANFIVIQYRLLIDRMPSIDSLIGGNIVGFAATFIAIYVPLSIIIGYWHRKSQWRVEAEALFKENRIGATMWLFVIDLIDGKITEQEKKEMREMLLKITKGNKIPKVEKSDKDNKDNEKFYEP
ncbi:MAG: hypothetical protein MUO21_02025 [Nitrososphaeraceae archaeon]|nr:hypothetical protein [Nitrososphaeraceae archaeon]